MKRKRANPGAGKYGRGCGNKKIRETKRDEEAGRGPRVGKRGCNTTTSRDPQKSRNGLGRFGLGYEGYSQPIRSASQKAMGRRNTVTGNPRVEKTEVSKGDPLSVGVIVSTHIGMNDEMNSRGFETETWAYFNKSHRAPFWYVHLITISKGARALRRVVHQNSTGSAPSILYWPADFLFLTELRGEIAPKRTRGTQRRRDEY